MKFSMSEFMKAESQSNRNDKLYLGAKIIDQRFVRCDKTDSGLITKSTMHLVTSTKFILVITKLPIFPYSLAAAAQPP